MTADTIAPDIREMPFEDALAELEKIVRQLEEGKGSLEGAITAYERGAMLKRHCEARLKEAQTRVEKIVLGPGGIVETQAAELE